MWLRFRVPRRREVLSRAKKSPGSGWGRPGGERRRLRFLCSRFGIAIARPSPVHIVKRLFSQHLAIPLSRPDENCQCLSTGLCLNFARRAAALPAFRPALASGGCMYIFSEKRTVYEYEPELRRRQPRVPAIARGPGNGARSRNRASSREWRRDLSRDARRDRVRPSRSTWRCSFSGTTRPGRSSPGPWRRRPGRASRSGFCWTDWGSLGELRRS